jgi:tetratricopeptide (TPR) repeat protein
MLKNVSVLSLILLLAMTGVLPAMPTNQKTFAHIQTEKSQTEQLDITTLDKNLLERQIAGGQQHIYSIDLAYDQFLFLDMQQLGTDVVVQLIDTEGKLRIETNAPDLSFGAEPFYWIAEKTGTYKIVVKVPEVSAKTGKYTIKIAELRAANSTDFNYLEAQKALAEGEKLRFQGKKENFLAALELYKKSAEHWKAVEKKEGIGVATNLIALITYYLGDTPKAIEYFAQAASVREGGGKAQSVSNLGSMYLITGEKIKALECFSQGLKLSKEVGDKITESNSLNGIGNLYYSFGDHQNALNSYSEALIIAKDTGDKTREAGALHNVGTVFASVGDFDKAISYFTETLPIWDELKDTQNKIYTLNYLGHVYRGLHQYDSALSYYNEVLEISSAKGQKRDQAITLVRVGQVYYLLRDYNKALDVCNKALEVSTSSADLLNQTTALNVLGSIYSTLGNENKALECFGKALEQAKTLFQESLQADLYYNIAKSNNKLGNIPIAISNIEKAIELSEKGRSKIYNRDLRTYYFATTQDFHTLYIDLLMKLHDQQPSKGHNAQALYVHELSQARTLLDLVKEAGIDIKQGVDGKLLEQESQLKRLSISKTEILIKVLNRPQSLEERTKLEHEIHQLEVELEQVQGKIRQSSPSYAACTGWND